MIGYRPLPGDDKILAPLSAEQRKFMSSTTLRKRAGRKGGKASRAVARHHSMFMMSVMREKK